MNAGGVEVDASTATALAAAVAAIGAWLPKLGRVMRSKFVQNAVDSFADEITTEQHHARHDELVSIIEQQSKALLRLDIRIDELEGRVLTLTEELEIERAENAQLRIENRRLHGEVESLLAVIGEETD